MNGSMKIGIGNALFQKWVDKLIEMVKQGNEVHLEFTPEETRIEVMPWKPFEYKCPYKGEEE